MTNNSFIQSLCNLIPLYNNLVLTESNNAWSCNTMGTNVCGKPVGTTQQEITWKLVFHLLANMVWATETRSSLLKVIQFNLIILYFCIINDGLLSVKRKPESRQDG
ncbi:unnamed protein product [Trichobilharzia regenti]|nr:unnamed protein product [Trichobilharzia regenti]